MSAHEPKSVEGHVVMFATTNGDSVTRTGSELPGMSAEAATDSPLRIIEVDVSNCPPGSTAPQHGIRAD